MKGYFEKMKKFVLAFGIPVLAVASLIGSGYATWYFNNTVELNSKNITVEPKEKQVVGAKFQQGGEGIKLVLDQTNKADGMPTGRLGVHFEGAFTESLIADVDGDATTSDKFVNGTSYKVTTTITIPSAVAAYVNFTFEGSTASEDGLTLTKETQLDVKEEDRTIFDAFFKISSDLHNTNVTVAYANEPTTLDAYNTMVKDVSGKTIDISFAAEIVK